MYVACFMFVLSFLESGVIFNNVVAKKQSRFTPQSLHRSTTDRIATLKMILQTRRELRRLSLVAYVDFRAAFDSVNRQSLWLLLKQTGVIQKLTRLLEDL